MEGQLRRGCGPAAGRKAVSAFLAASVLYLGLAQNKAGADTQPEKDQAEQTELSRVKALNQEVPSYSQMYDNLIKEGTELAANPEKKKEAVEAFMKAIQLYPEKAQKQLSTLDEKTRAVYMEAMQKASKPSLEEPSTEKKKKSNTALWIVGGIVVGAAAGYGIYKLLNKESPKPTPPPQPVKVTLDFDVYNHTKGYLTHFTLSDIVEGSAVTINISDLGVSGVLIEPAEANSMRVLLEEITQALSGIRKDGGTSANPYISLDDRGYYANDGARAIQLNNLLPVGFKLSTTEIPAVVVNINSQDKDSMFSPLKPGSSDRRYVLYEGRQGARSSHEKRPFQK